MECYIFWRLIPVQECEIQSASIQSMPNTCAPFHSIEKLNYQSKEIHENGEVVEPDMCVGVGVWCGMRKQLKGSNTKLSAAKTKRTHSIHSHIQIANEEIF
jgi:hypothetical protein